MQPLNVGSLVSILGLLAAQALSTEPGAFFKSPQGSSLGSSKGTPPRSPGRAPLESRSISPAPSGEIAPDQRPEHATPQTAESELPVRLGRTQSLPGRLDHSTPQAQRLFGRLHYQAALRGRPRVVPEQAERLRGSPAAHAMVVHRARVRLAGALREAGELLAQHLERCELALGSAEPAPAQWLTRDTFYAWHCADAAAPGRCRYVAQWGDGNIHAYPGKLARCAPLRARLQPVAAELREQRALLAHAMAPAARSAGDRAALAEARALLVEAKWVRELGHGGIIPMWLPMWWTRRRLQPPLHAPLAEQGPDGEWHVARGSPLPWARMWLEPHTKMPGWQFLMRGWYNLVGRDFPPPTGPGREWALWESWED